MRACVHIMICICIPTNGWLHISRRNTSRWEGILTNVLGGLKPTYRDACIKENWKHLGMKNSRIRICHFCHHSPSRYRGSSDSQIILRHECVVFNFNQLGSRWVGPYWVKPMKAWSWRRLSVPRIHESWVGKVVDLELEVFTCNLCWQKDGDKMWRVNVMDLECDTDDS